MFPLPTFPTWAYALILFVTFTIGGAIGAGVTVRIYAGAHERALVEQKAAIVTAKKIEYTRAVADTEKRLAAATKSETKFRTIIKKQLVKGKCEAPVEAMRDLNDPALVGETQ